MLYSSKLKEIYNIQESIKIPVWVMEKHKVNININEGGTEASAATVVVINRVTSIDPFLEPFEFKANRPFLYMIYDKKSKNILFLGKYTGRN